ncbi:MAG: hypothetical protein IPJ87_04860 [Flavobacteriales bacterium]|nr:hypothetical protein [Flavobacteriales bacterium]MBK7941191.1 hypothetical protein [Flavobacteriales bacterium]MBK8948732.1 hypothetical protein [Flavobacteriales bacterium]MBK9701219.1 hypothetical protein [Flavobacteriales bacterium]
MLRISFLTRERADAIELARALYSAKLALFLTIEAHTEIELRDDAIMDTPLIHLSGMTKALLYRQVEEHAQTLLGERLVRTWAEAVTSLDPASTEQLFHLVRPV